MSECYTYEKEMLMLPTSVQIDSVILKKGYICGLFTKETNVLSDVIRADC